MLNALRERGRHGELPFEGQWLTADAIRFRLRRRQRASWTIAVELLLLFTVMSLFGLGLIGLTALLAY